MKLLKKEEHISKGYQGADFWYPYFFERRNISE